MRFRTAAVGLFAALLTVTPAAAAYPDRPVRLLVGLSAGSSVDLVARMLANHFTEKFKQPFIVENRSGAQGLIAAKEVANAAPNGYTLHLTASIPAMEVTMKEGANISEQFSYISVVRRSPTYLAMTTKRPFKDFPDLVAFAKTNPHVLNYGSIARVLELYTVAINKAAGIDAVQIAFRGSSEASAALAAGDIDYYLELPVTMDPFVSQGMAKLVASTGAKRSLDRPDIPSLAEVGVPGLDLLITYGLIAPKGTPDAVVSTLNAGVREFVAIPAVIDRFLAMAQGVPVASTPEEFKMYVAAETRILLETAKSVGLDPQ